MALLALQPGMLSYESVTGLFVIEGFRVPLDDGEVQTVVIGVALGAFLAGTGPDAKREMQALVSREAGSNLSMAVEALEGGFASTQFVTSSTVRRSVEFFVGTGQRPGRNLGNGGGRQKGDGQNQDELGRRHEVE
jgi:hypothetical protein